ncbi:BTAD domain-containing putative transcriptional regulator [Nonomuraea sp. NPDC050663]|uniref:AfsR/SARP family transcriptional regulator n=1 Tax=Nonomuraea sp. NPDC050663 TaxID=3364370 RepID=UPI0037A27758
MRFKVLGPLVVDHDGHELRVGGSLQRVVLALLLLDANRTVPLERLIEATWGEDPPSTARNQIQIRVSQLRRMLGDHDQTLLLTRAPGYQIRVEPGRLDLADFDALVARAQEEEPARAAATLRSALELWRGPALSDVDSELIRRVVHDLDERRTLAHERCVDLELGLGHHQQLVAELRRLVQEHPLRERPHGQLMLALYRSGRHAEALEVYRAFRQMLLDNLGLEPSDELRRLEHAILNQEPALGNRAEPVAPRQLPPMISRLAGRQAELDRLQLLLRPESCGDALPIAALTGRAGVGKTELALHAAHRMAAAYPHGQLYVDLRGGELQPADVLSRFLRALGVVSAPTTIEERSALFRSTVADRHVLLVLDNAGSFEQIWPLLPGGAPGGVLITSRDRLVGLPDRQVVRLDLLDHAAAVDLLSQDIGAERTLQDPAALDTLAEQCGGLPLALRIAGARLAVRPSWRVQTLVDLLSDTTTMLDVLSYGEHAVRAGLQVSYEALSPDAQALFRAIGLMDFPQVTGWLAELLLDRPADAARAALTELADASLLRDQGDRYGMHDLVRAHAAELARDEDPRLVARVCGFLFALAQRAHEFHGGGSHGLLREESVASDRIDALLGAHPLAVLDDERVALRSAVRRAAALGLHELAWKLALALATMHEIYGYFEDWRSCTELALEACVAAGDLRGEAAMRYSLSTLLTFEQEYGAAAESMEAALALFGRAGEAHGRGLALGNLAQVDVFRGQPERALERYEEALPLLKDAGDRPAEAYALVNMAAAGMSGGDLTDAGLMLEQALEIFRAEGVARGEAQALDRLARLELHRDRPAEAAEHFQAAAQLIRSIGDRVGEVYVMQGLAEAWRRLGRAKAAERTLRAALDLAAEVGDRLIAGRIRLSLGLLLDDVAQLELARAVFTEIDALHWRAKAEEALARLGS